MRYFLELCLKSVLDATRHIDAEVIVVDNKSADDSCEMVKALFPEVILIENAGNYGFSKGNNIGVSKAKGEYVCILNPDTVVANDTFDKVLTFADKQSDLGIIGCKLIDGTGCFLPESKRNIPTPLVAFKKILGFTNSYYANQLREDSTGEVDVLVGAFMIIKRTDFNQVKGFDEDYFMYGEDVDLSYKILKAGLKNYYFGETTVIHFKGESTLRNKEYAKRFNGAMQIFYQKHFAKHVLLEAFLKVVIKGLVVLNLQPVIKERIVNSIVFISEHKNSHLSAVLKFLPEVKLVLDTVKNNQQVIFNNNYLSFSQIIALMEKYQYNNTISFRILPQNSNFVIGSDNAVSRGEVTYF